MATMRACISSSAVRAAPSDRLRLHARQGRHDGERIGDAMIDLAQEQFGAFLRLADFPVGLLLGETQLLLPDRGRQRLAQQFAELALDMSFQT